MRFLLYFILHHRILFPRSSIIRKAGLLQAPGFAIQLTSHVSDCGSVLDLGFPVCVLDDALCHAV